LIFDPAEEIQNFSVEKLKDGDRKEQPAVKQALFRFQLEQEKSEGDDQEIDAGIIRLQGKIAGGVEMGADPGEDHPGQDHLVIFSRIGVDQKGGADDQ